MVTDGIMLDDLENLCELDAERSMVNQVVMDIEGINLKKKMSLSLLSHARY